MNNDRTGTLARQESPGASQNRGFPPDPVCRHYRMVQRENGEMFEKNQIFSKLIWYVPDLVFRCKFNLYHLKRSIECRTRGIFDPEPPYPATMLGIW